MTNEANIEIITGIYAAFSKGDAQAILARLDEDIDWEFGYPHNADIPWLRSGRGHQHVLGFLQSLSAFDIKRFELVACMGDGPWVVALVSIQLVHKVTGRTIDEPCEPHVWKLGPNGRASHMRHAADTRMHARVAGLG